MQRQGKKYSEKVSDHSTADAKRDQSVFLKRCMIRRWPEFPKKVIAGAGYHQLLSPGDARGGSGGEGVTVQKEGDASKMDVLEFEEEDQDEILDPLDILLDYILETSGTETAIASDKDVQSIDSNRVVDFASYLRQVQPPVEVNGALGWLRMEDVICHRRERALVRCIITASSLSQWPGITFDGAGCLQGSRIFIGPTQAKCRPLKSKRLTFSDPRRPSNGCKSFALSTDGKLLAALFHASNILIWRLSDSLLVQCLRHWDDTGEVSSLSFSPNDCTLVSGCNNKSTIIWEIQSCHVLLRLEGHGGPVNRVTYALHGALIATGSHDSKSAKIWDSSTGACLHSFSFDEGIYKLIFSSDASRLYIEMNRSCHIYDIQTYTHSATLC
ncbi:uncharacterized protein PHACADRAFT_191195 [Phanerochaete carnosa HHB-10118-sp]|uniref:Uncharacterized protein n=1 Tax=Phanerochaete carnosa (strain HHB-10118-sp) TaxID=650164 RepID=K5V7Z5_PHACS|nr:uncharacterized protein PHACADRAFT_191195 [Phanerochaete carnosa HHB-10118-sp]EKM58881.1 hypothetical protein PHACADRAFT_191195 [Phanerochaete carnosa HHB-10118-sp]